MNAASRQAVLWYLAGTGGNLEQAWDWLCASGVPGWTLASTGDFNRDGYADLVWVNDVTRQAVIWYMGGTHGLLEQAWAWLAQMPVYGWRIPGIADTNNDRTPDLISRIAAAGRLHSQVRRRATNSGRASSEHLTPP